MFQTAIISFFTVYKADFGENFIEFIILISTYDYTTDFIIYYQSLTVYQELDFSILTFVMSFMTTMVDEFSVDKGVTEPLSKFNKKQVNSINLDYLTSISLKLIIFATTKFFPDQFDPDLFYPNFFDLI